MRLFFSAGEASGDAYAAEILRRLQPRPLGQLADHFTSWAHDHTVTSVEEARQLLRESRGVLDSLSVVELIVGFEKEFGVTVPQEVNSPEHALDFIESHLSSLIDPARVTVAAIGGRRVEAAGAFLVADSSRWGAVGILESIKVSPRVIVGMLKAKKELRRGRPGLFVPIDFGFLNIKLARYAKRKGWKVLYFVPPGSWRRTKQGTDLPAVTDAIVTPFPWSAEILNGMGANAHFFGHPLKDMVAHVSEPEVRDGIAVLPGSRTHEIESNVPVIALALKGLPGPVRIALAPSADEETLRREWTKWSEHEPIIVHKAATALKASRSAIVCSGTATLEAALSSCPCVVMYRGGWAMNIEFRIRRPKFDYISLPNILLDRPLLTELLAEAASPEALRKELDALHQDGERRREVLAAFAELSQSLGEPDCLDRTAELARLMLKS